MDVVLHVPDPDRVARALGNAENLLADESIDVDVVALVANGDAVRALRAGGEFADDLTVALDRGISVRACANSMAGRDLDADELLPGVEIVPSAMGELARLQAEGYAYVRP